MNLGMLKVWITRLQSYLGLGNFFMILYLFISKEPLGLNYKVIFLLMIISITIVMFVDILLIFPQTQSYSYNKNPEWIKMKKDIKKILERLEK